MLCGTQECTQIPLGLQRGTVEMSDMHGRPRRHQLWTWHRTRTRNNHKTSWELYICMDMYIIDCDSSNRANENNRLSIISQSWRKSSLKLYAGISFESGCFPYYAICLSFELSLSLLSDYIFLLKHRSFSTFLACFWGLLWISAGNAHCDFTAVDLVFSAR